MIVFETVLAQLYRLLCEERWPHGLEMVSALLLVGGVGLAARRHFG